MRILTSTWKDGYLDYALLPGHCRISVRLWCVLRTVEDLYWVPARDWRMVMNYVGDVGIRGAMGKAMSRLRERTRNAKFLACGIGRVEQEDGGGHTPGTMVMFVAPAHPLCAERVVIPAALLRPLKAGSQWRELPNHQILFFDARDANACPEAEVLAGWSHFSGETLPAEVAWKALESVRLHLESLGAQDAGVLPAVASATEEWVAGRRRREGAMRACVVGYGHYAKTRVIPALSRKMMVGRVHEIDPVQLGEEAAFDRDTSPELRADEDFDVYFIAGYHHTHAPIAVDALRRGASVVVEKPIATTVKQLESLIATMEGSRGRLFSGYQRRYSELTGLARRDLHAGDGRAISYHCLVHEVKLPRRHWYLWPNSGSRVVSNGCHWVDHFLLMNDFAAPLRFGAWQSAGGDVIAFAELTNGAAFSMTLTDNGSSRLGVEDTVEMRAGDVTVRISNDTTYRAENSRRILRQRRINRLTSYQKMYAEISRKLLAGEPGEDAQAVRISAGLTLQLQESLQTRTAEVSA